jgi:hypothetical protein
MLDEELDKVIKDAASQHHPPYDDKAWEKMEELLDKHLPQKKDRKRPFIFLLFFLLLGSGVFFAVKHFNDKKEEENIAGSNDKNKTGTIEKGKTLSATEAGNNTASTNSGSPSSPAANDGKINNEQINGAVLPTAPANSNTPSTKKGSAENAAATTAENNKKTIRSKDAGSATGKTANENNYAYAKKNTHSQRGRLNMKVKKPVGYEEQDKQNTEKATGETTTADITANTETDKNNSTTFTTADTTQKKNAVTTADEKEKSVPEKNNTAPTEKEKKKKKNSFGNNFAITLSAGADMSYIKLNNAGKVKPVVGAGLSYNFGKHLTVSSGLYVSKKVYSALPDDYHFTGYVYPYLVNIDGDCKIYEIPLNVYYNFKQVKHHNWLAGAGISSFLMKEESYDYNYKYPGGQTYTRNYAVSNENNHYFSVLTVSAGYKYKFSNRFSFIAEPYMKIPLGGVGAGKVKLNSAGVLVTAAIYPFVKKK